MVMNSVVSVVGASNGVYRFFTGGHTELLQIFALIY